MPTYKRRIDVMVSSTTRDLGAYRRRVGAVVSRLQFVPRIMDLDATTGKDGVSYSLDLVDEAEIYILLLGFRYGYVPDDPRNPQRLSMTQLEFERALEREARGELCVLPFVMAEDAADSAAHVEEDDEARIRWRAFRDKVLLKQVSFFQSLDDLEIQVMQALTMSECVRRWQQSDGDAHQFVPHAGETLDGRYIFEQKLGQGGNGVVWRVSEYGPDGEISRTAAIKVLTPEVSAKPERVARFKKEISYSYRLTHPNIIRTTHWGVVGAQFYAVMDYIDGVTLREKMTGQRFSSEATVRYLGQIAEALDVAHKQGIVHRDVKPANIMVARDRLYLGDFGLMVSSDDDTRLTPSGEWVGTKKYMSPEQWYNQTVSPQTDIYALGLMAYEMLTGQYPFDASSQARLFEQHKEDDLPPHPDLPDEILRILQRACAKLPSERYATASEFITELTHWRLDPANIETKIEKYLSTVRNQRRMAAFEKLFVDLEGDIREVLPATNATPSDAPDDDFDELLDLFLVDLDADHHEPQQPSAHYVPNIIEQLTRSERIVLVGEPGSGKSFTLGRLVLHYITHYARFQRIPVFVALNAFKGETSFTDYIRQQMGDLAPYYDQLQAESRLVLICDALNEMPRQAVNEGRTLVNEVRATLADAPYFVVSCRVRDYHNDLDSLQLERLEVRDLDLPAIHAFVMKYLRANGEAFWQRMGGSDALFSFWRKVSDNGEPERFWQPTAGLPGYTSTEGDTAWRAMWAGAKLIPLARNPYMAKVVCALHKRQDLPENRAELYKAFVVDLYERELKHAEARGQTFPERDELEDCLTDLAQRLQAAQSTTIKRDAIPDREMVLQAALDATMLIQEGDDLRFAHQLLQEYFAAKTLAARMYADDDPHALLGESWWQLNVWRETALMLAEFTGEVERVARWLGQASPPLAIETLQRHYGDAWRSHLSDDLHALLVQTSLEKIKPQVEPTVAARCAVGYALGVLGDPRRGVGVRDGVPDIIWVEIPAGSFRMGSDPALDPQAYDNELPLRDMTLPRYFIAQYAVTNAQFQAFIKAGGYDDPAYWTEAGWQWRIQLDRTQPAYFDDSEYNIPNYPVNGISCHEAEAFARWLDRVLLDRPDPALRVQLPTEAQWERAARGTQGLIYPYGNEFDPTKGNTDETGIGTTMAVGLFPHGASPDGVLDMSGNSYAWCLNKPGEALGYHLPVDDRPEGDLRPIIRGGSFVSLRKYARTAYRYAYSATNWSYNWGLRCVLA